MTQKSSSAYRILHTADWHLGKMLNEQSREPEQKLFLDWLLKQVIELEVDVVLVAGDIFDTTNPPQSAEKLYFDFVADLHRLTSANLVLVAGNHDSVTQLDAPKRMLKALRTYVVGLIAESPSERILCLPDQGAPKIAIAMVPFLRERDLRLGSTAENDNEVRSQIRTGIIECYQSTADAAKKLSLKCPIIATGHLTVAGAAASESERIIHIGGLGNVDASIFPSEFAYVALGHLHRPQAPDKQGRVRYSGSPIPLSFSEITDKKEVRILDVEGDVIKDSAFPIPTFRKLVQLKTEINGIETGLRALGANKISEGELLPWVEVVVSGLVNAQDIADQARLHAQGLSFEILKVTLSNQSQRVGPGVDGKDDIQAIEALTDKPTEVFDLLLSQQEALLDERKEALRLAFAQLIEKSNQSN